MQVFFKGEIFMGTELELTFYEPKKLNKHLYIEDERNIFLKLDNNILGIFNDATGIKFISTNGKNIKYDYNSCIGIYTTWFINDWLHSLINYDNMSDFDRTQVISKTEFFKELNRIKDTYFKFERKRKDK